MDREIANIKYIQKPKLDEFPYENLKNLTKNLELNHSNTQQKLSQK